MDEPQQHLPRSFDPRTEISAGDKHVANQIVMHLWIILVVIPVFLTILYTLLKPRG